MLTSIFFFGHFGNSFRPLEPKKSPGCTGGMTSVSVEELPHFRCGRMLSTELGFSCCNIFYLLKKLPPSCFLGRQFGSFFFTDLGKVVFLFFCCWLRFIFFVGPKGLQQFCLCFLLFEAVGVFSSQPALGMPLSSGSRVNNTTTCCQ